MGVKKNPSSAMYTQLGVITKGTIIEVNVSELGLVTTGGKVVWAKYAQGALRCASACASAHPLGCFFRLSSHAPFLFFAPPLALTVTNNPELDGCINGVLLV